MKKKVLAVICSMAMAAGCFAGATTVFAKGEKIALITMDSIDQHWVTLNEGAQEEAKKEEVTVDYT